MNRDKEKFHSLGNTLKLVFDERKLSIRAAAKIAGVSPSQVHAWLNGAHPHDMQAVLRLCVELKLDFQFLLTGVPSSSLNSKFMLEEIFDIEAEPRLSGLFLIETKRLKTKKSNR